jgi:hypothetical protein
MIEMQQPNDDRRPRPRFKSRAWAVLGALTLVIGVLTAVVLKPQQGIILYGVNRPAVHAWTMVLSMLMVWLLLRVLVVELPRTRNEQSPRLRFSLLQLLLFMTSVSVLLASLAHARVLLTIVAAFVLGGGGAMLAAKASGSPDRWWIRGILGAWIGLAVWLFLLPMHVGLSPNTRELPFVLGLSLVLACLMGPAAASVVRNRQGRHPQ